MRNRLWTALIIVLMLLLVDSKSYAMPQAVAQSWSNGYTFRRAITIDHTKVPNADQLDFPVLISGTYSYLASTANGGKVTNMDGYDIIFTSDANGTNTLAFEQESYNGATGALNYWVKVPAVSHTTDAVIYLFYGNPSVVTDPSNATGVWDNNYTGIWHLSSEVTPVPTTDSTLNANTGSIVVPAGQIGGWTSLDGRYIDISGSANNAMPSYTVQAWLKRDVTQPTGYGTFMSRHPSGGGNQHFLVTSDGEVYRWDFSATTTISANTWHHVVYSYDGTTEKFYIDGAAAGSNVATLGWDANNWRFGMDTGGDHPYGGLMEEIRISNSNRSADWIATEYNNQIDPSQFYSIGSVEIGEGSSGLSILELSANPPSLIFGNIGVGSNATLLVTFTNTGNADVTISNVNISGAGFNSSGLYTGQILLSGQNATLDVTFVPSATGSATGSVTVSSDASNSPTTISLWGSGVQALRTVTLSWNPSTSTVVGYHIYRSTVAGGPYTKLTATPVLTTTYTDVSVQSESAYYYAATCVTSENMESSFSNEASAIIP